MTTIAYNSVYSMYATTSTTPLSAHTDPAGKFDFHLPQPQAKYTHLLFRKDAYVGDSDMVSTTNPFNTDMEKLPYPERQTPHL